MLFNNDAVQLWKGDCLELMANIPDASMDLILCDPPYGTTACKWDSVISFEPMWAELRRIIKPNGVIALFGTEPFSSLLRVSNLKMYKYDWIWKKNIATNFLHAKRQPLRDSENISIFYKKPNRYYAIKTEGHIPTQSAKGSSSHVLWNGENKRNYEGGDTVRYPKTIIDFNVHDLKNRLHPTQKPVTLLEYLIKTYTQESETILDFAMGSGSTGVACINTGRRFIGIEKDEHYFQVAKDRLEKAIEPSF